MAPNVKLYALSTCIHCKNTKAYLDDCGVLYDCVFVDKLAGQERSDVIAEVKKHNPALSFPTVVIGDEVVIGFNKDKITEALKK
jgi:glutaredoxin